MKKKKKKTKNKNVLAALAGLGGMAGLLAYMARRRRSARQRGVAVKSRKIVSSGKAMAAILSAATGSFILGLLSFIAGLVKPAEELLTFYQPSGSVSGISTLAIAGWLLSWALFYLVWRNKSVSFSAVFALALLLIGLGLLFMFPPFIEMFS